MNTARSATRTEEVRAARAYLLFVIALIATLGGIARAAPAPQTSPAERDALLRWEGDRHGTLGSTGQRIFAQRVEPGLGLRGVFGYGDATALFHDPIQIELYRGGQVLALEREAAVWFPSHLEVTWSAPGLRVLERKGATDDDALFDRVELTNTSPEGLELEVYAGGRATPLLPRLGSEQERVDLSGVANLNAAAAGEELGPELAWLARLQGRLERDYLSYYVPEAQVSDGANLVALRGGREGQPIWSLPEQVAFGVPDTGPAVSWLHFLCAVVELSGTAEPGAGSPASFRIELDDGSSEELPWPSVPEGSARSSPGPLLERAEWRRLPLPGFERLGLQLSYRPPPGRFVRGVQLRKGSGSALPVLIAGCHEALPELGRIPVLLGQPQFLGAPVNLALAGGDFVLGRTPEGERCLRNSFELEPGQTRAFQLVLATGRQVFPTGLRALGQAEDPGSFDKHVGYYWSWYEEQVPRFSCSDPLLEEAWHYRWFLVRHNLRRGEWQGVSLPVFFRGLHGVADTAVLPWAAAQVVAETRWLRDPDLAAGSVRALFYHQGRDGLVRAASPSHLGGWSPHRLAEAVWGAYQVQGNPATLKESLPMLARELTASLAAFDPDGDLLPCPPPAEGRCICFGEVEAEPGAPRVERIGAAADLHASAVALAAICAELGEERRAADYERLAGAIAAAVLDAMWTGEGGFRSVLEEGGEALACRELDGLRPFLSGLAPDEAPFRAALGELIDPGVFRTPQPFTTLVPGPGRAATCLGEPRVRPHDEATAIEVLAAALRSYGPSAVTPEELERALRAYARLHFEDGDPGRPLLRESYDPQGGAAAGHPDCLDSAFNDLLIRHLGGLVPGGGEAVELWPLVGGLEHFSFRSVPYRGRLLDITWDRPDGVRHYAHAPEGYTLAADGAQLHNGPPLEHLWLMLPPKKNRIDGD